MIVQRQYGKLDKNLEIDSSKVPGSIVLRFVVPRSQGSIAHVFNSSRVPLFHGSSFSYSSIVYRVPGFHSSMVPGFK